MLVLKKDFIVLIVLCATVLSGCATTKHPTTLKKSNSVSRKSSASNNKIHYSSTWLQSISQSALQIGPLTVYLPSNSIDIEQLLSVKNKQQTIELQFTNFKMIESSQPIAKPSYITKTGSIFKTSSGSQWAFVQQGNTYIAFDARQNVSESNLMDMINSLQIDETAKARIVRHPNSITVLVNKQNRLPANFVPKHLVVPNIPFLYSGNGENHLMRRVAATALEKLVKGALHDSIYIYGVSAYRSYQTQKILFDQYVKAQGVTKARQYSALPGESEHETGLAIDVSGSSGKCAVQNCFANTRQAIWLAKYAWKYGFIVRYPKGKMAYTGYSYEPWHIRYIGKKIAKIIETKHLTLEQYLQG